MLWFYLAILSVAIWAAVNIVDKHLLNRGIPAAILLAVSASVSIPVVLLAPFVAPVAFPEITVLALALLVGIIAMPATLLYFRGIHSDEVSRSAPILHHTVPLFVLVLATFFLREIFTPQNYAGIALLIVGGLLISLRRGAKIRISKAFWLMMGSSALFASTNVVLDYVLMHTDYWTAFYLEHLGIILGTVPIAFYYRAEIGAWLSKKTDIGYAFFSQCLDIAPTFTQIMALSFGYVSMVAAVESTQSIFVLAYAVLLSAFFPQILKEELQGGVVALKVLAIALMVLGSLLII